VAYPRLHYAKLTEMLLLTVAILGALSSHPVYAAPLPHAVSGVLTFGDEPVMDHLLVEAKISDRIVAATYTKDGRFGYDPYFKVPADDPFTPETEGGREGDAVQLYLDGAMFLEFTFESGRITNYVEDLSYLFNDPPTALTETHLTGVLGYSVLLDASGSTDPNGDELTYTWSHDDGSTSTGEIASHVFHTVGAHTTTLTISDLQGLEDSLDVEITIEPPPGPCSWTNSVAEGGRQMKIAINEDETTVWLTTLDPTTVSILKFNKIFLSNHLPIIHGENMFALIYDQGKLAYPVYIETLVPESMLRYGAKIRLNTWEMGAWRPIQLSGVISGENRAWAYLDASTLGEGIYVVAVDQTASGPTLDEVQVTRKGESIEITARFDHPNPLYNAYLRVDDRLVGVSSVAQEEVSFKIRDLKPGGRSFKLNGVKKEIMIHSEENIYFLFSLSAIPVALTTLVFKKFS
jgi:PKD repeat protein